MTIAQDRLRILDQIDAGALTAEEGVRRLQALNELDPRALADLRAAAGMPATPNGRPAPAGPAESPAPAAPPPDLARWRRWWLLPFGLGLALTLLSSGLLYWALRAAEFQLSGWFLLALAPFAFSVTLMALAAASRSARWLHLRVNTGQAEWPRRITLSFPLPIRLTAWALRTCGHRIPQLKQTGVDELVLALGETTSPQNPLYVEVDQGPDGEKVQVYVG
jgi:hypothetical protein